MNNVIRMLKASGHQITLIINTGSARPSSLPQHARPAHHYQHQRRKGEEDERDQARCERNGDDIDQCQDESCDDSLSNTDPRTSNINAMNYSDGKSSSQDTVDDIAGSPVSFGGDTRFNGMGNILSKVRMPVDLHRTSSAPLVSEIRAGLEASTDSSCAGTEREYDRELDLGSVTTGGSLQGLDCTDESEMVLPTFKDRLKLRTSSDGTVEKASVCVSTLFLIHTYFRVSFSGGLRGE